MSSGNELIEKIELYTSGKMNEVERTAFENELALDEQLQKQLDLSLFADEMVVAHEALKLKEQMKKDLYRSKPNPKPNWNIYGLIAFIGLAGGLYGYYKVNSVTTVPQHSIPADQEQVVAHDLPQKTDVGGFTQPEKKDKEKTIPSVKPAYSLANTRLAQENVLSEDVSDNANELLSSSEATIRDTVKKEEETLQSVADVPAVDPCLALKGDVRFSVTASCKGEDNGTLQVYEETVKGGMPPYTFIINGKQSPSRFEDLPAGTYTLIIKDSRNCTVESTSQVVVGERICATTKAYVFNPEYDRFWSVPYNRSKDPVKLVLIEKSGKVYYQSEVQNYQPEEWSGESNMGLGSGAGLYFFTIEYSDGSTDEGTITITR
jgi:hypothetical protein